MCAKLFRSVHTTRVSVYNSRPIRRQEIFPNIPVHVKGLVACGYAVRTASDIKKKWADLKRIGIHSAAEATHPKTGGGPKPPRPWYVDTVLDVLGEGTSLITGIEGEQVKVRHSHRQTCT